MVNSGYATGRLCNLSLVNILFRRTLSVTPLQSLPANKNFEHLAKFNILQTLHLYNKNLFLPQTSDLLEKLALIFLNNIHREQCAKIKIVIAKNQCEKT